MLLLSMYTCQPAHQPVIFTSVSSYKQANTEEGKDYRKKHNI